MLKKVYHGFLNLLKIPHQPEQEYTCVRWEITIRKRKPLLLKSLNDH